MANKTQIKFCCISCQFQDDFDEIIENVDKAFHFPQHLDDPVIEYYPMIR